MSDTNPEVPELIKPSDLPEDYTKAVYDYCKKNCPGIIKIARFFIRRTKLQFDNQVAIEGVTGSGKSMFTFLLACCNQQLLRKKLIIEKQCCFVPNEGELKKEIRALAPGEIYWIDESIRALDKKRWYQQDQMDLNVIVKTDRYKTNTIFYLIQRFAELTESFRNHNIYWRIYIIPHYAAVLFAMDIDKDIEDPWHTKHNLSIKYKSYRGSTRYQALINPETRLKKEIKLPNYVDHTLFPNLEDIPHLKPCWIYYQMLKHASREKLKIQEQTIKPIDAREKRWRECFKVTYRTLKKLCPQLTHVDLLKHIGLQHLTNKNTLKNIVNEPLKAPEPETNLLGTKGTINKSISNGEPTKISIA